MDFPFRTMHPMPIIPNRSTPSMSAERQVTFFARILAMTLPVGGLLRARHRTREAVLRPDLR
ncbi:MAG: hypothetical protein ABJA80_11360 [bacterium]